MRSENPVLLKYLFAMAAIAIAVPFAVTLVNFVIALNGGEVSRYYPVIFAALNFFIIAYLIGSRWNDRYQRMGRHGIIVMPFFGAFFDLVDVMNGQITYAVLPLLIIASGWTFLMFCALKVKALTEQEPVNA